MNSLDVCDAVNWQLKLSGVSVKEAKAIKTCVSRYTHLTERDGIKEKIKSFIHRICNAVRCALGSSKLGLSDWEKAERVIAKNIYSYVPPAYRSLVENKTRAQVHQFAGKVLNFLIWENEKQLYVPSFIKSHVEAQMNILPMRWMVAKMTFSTKLIRLLQQTFPNGVPSGN